MESTQIIQVSSYQELKTRPEWKKKRQEILRRDHFKCRNCGKTSDLEIHLKQYHFVMRNACFKLPWEYRNNLLITLCSTCHREGHKNFDIPVCNV